MNRRFVDLTSDQISALLEADSLPMFGHSRGIEWPELLRSPRVTIISEAGSGKTYECQTQQRLLFGRGEPAFFFELSELARFDTLASFLTPEEQTRLTAWHNASDQVATFFLDAYDELKLTQGKFRTALTRLRSFIAANLDRVRLVVTSRPVPFESELLGQLFPLSPPPRETRTFVDDVMGTALEARPAVRDVKAAPLWRTVCLMPLDEASISAFVVDQGLADVDAFLEDLRRRDAFDFARRPQDLIELCQDWKDHRRIRAHRDQVETNIALKLRPRTDREEAAPLFDTRAREGAATLALAALLMKSMTIRHSAEALEGDAGEPAVDPTRLLSDWTEKERRTLLERPLFSYASYGRVRFHHRSVLEFLAAERLQSLMRAGMSRRAVKRLLFARTAQGIDVVRPSLRPAAAWLALHDPDIFGEICRREPEILICLGDPSSLSIEQRMAVLAAFLGRNRNGTWRGHHVPRVQTQRFAHRGLGATVREHWDTCIENGEMREFLLELAAITPLPEMANPAIDVFRDSTAPDTERIDALRTLLALNDPRLSEIVTSMAAEPSRWSNRLLGYSVIELFPHFMFGEKLQAILLALGPSKSSVDAITWNWPEQIQGSALTASAAESLRRLLHHLVVEGAGWKTQGHVLETPRPHLVPALAAACLREHALGTPSVVWMDAAVPAIRFLNDREYDENRPVGSLRRAIAELSAKDRSTAFWADDAFLQRFNHRDDPWERFHDLAYDGVIDLEPERDRAWVLAAVSDRGLAVRERQIALYAAIRSTAPDAPVSVAYWETLQASVADSAALSDELARALAPRTPDPKLVEWQARAEKEKLKREKKKANVRKSWEDFQTQVLADPEDAFSKKKSKNTCWNLWTGMRRGDEFREIGWDRTFIETHFNVDIADSFRLAMMEHWRDVHAPLAYERAPEDRSTFFYSWLFALAGVHAEAEDRNWARALSPEEAAQAARIATHKLHGLPEWLSDLAVSHASTVEATLGPDLTSGLNEGKRWSDYLRAFRDCAPELRSLFIPRIRTWLESALSTNGLAKDSADSAALLRQAVLVLLAHDDRATREFLEESAAHALLGPMNSPSAITWAQTLLRLNPERGTSELEHLFNTNPGPSKDLKEVWIAAIFGDRHGQGIPVDFASARFAPALLLRLVLLAYASVRPSEDVHHEGTYSPDTRDDAQTGRSAILGALLDREGQDAWQAKLRLADDPLLCHFRDRAIALAREKSASEADRERFNEGEVTTIVTRYDVPPRTRADMASLLADRLDNIEDLLLGDTSPRELWAGIQKENLLRREIARELARMANNLYVVNQEAVTADEKETDIRLASITSEQEGVVELKRAEGFSGRELLNTIFDQLVSRYLAPENRRAGVLVISLSTKEYFEHPDTGARQTPEEFLATLKAEASRIVEHMGCEISLDVRLLDLRPRLRVGRSA